MGEDTILASGGVGWMGAVRKPRQRGGRSRILGVHSRIGDCLKQDFDRDLWD